MKKNDFRINRNILIIVILNIILVSFCVWGITCFITPKIGYVRTKVLIQNYKGMKDAQQVLDKKKELWQQNLDTLALKHDQRVMALGNKKPNQTESEVLNKSLEQYNQYMERVNKLSQDEEVKLMSGVINQITSQINEYAKDNNYDYIFGTTDQGNLLYGNNKKDITEDLLKYLNSIYEK